MKSLKKIIAIFIVLGLIVSFIPVISNAAITDQEESGTGQINRVTTTNYFTTIQLKGTFENSKTGEVEEFNLTSEEIAGNYTDEEVVAKIEQMKGEFQDWAIEQGATVIEFTDEQVADYYYDAHDEITQENSNQAGSDVILVGDIDDLDSAYTGLGQITINTILDKHQTFAITAVSGTYKMLDGEGQEHKISSKLNLVFKANGDLSKLKEIKVDDKTVDSDKYVTEAGSTIVTLKEDYLDTLDLGKHTLAIVYNDGEVTTEFTIAPTNNPPTGDSIALYASIFVIAMLGIVAVCKVNKK